MGGTAASDQARLSPAELEVWRAFLRAHAQVVRRLEADLLERHGLALAWYDVMVQLVEAPGRRVRMTELAERVLISRSGLTRLVDRMVAAGLLRREACDTDARGYFAVLTDEGYDRLRRASGTHLRGVSERVTSRFSPPELADLGGYLARLTDP